MTVDRSDPFEKRRALYAGLDRRFSTRTRFFAAAALIYAVFSQFFRVLPGPCFRGVYHFLRDAGDVLTTENLRMAKRLSKEPSSGSVLDQRLVLREQTCLQSFMDDYQSFASGQWKAAHRGLNNMLNKGHPFLLCPHWSTQVRDYRQLLGASRAQVNLALDFADITHRIHIGLRLIHHVRQHEILV